MKRRKILLIASMTVILLLAASCSSDTATDADVEGSSNVVVVEQTDDGLSSTNLIFGSFQLEDTDMAITAEQAVEMAPLWKVYQSMVESSTAAEAEREALVNQITDVFTIEQQDFLAAIDTSMEAVQASMTELGIEEEMKAGRGMMNGEDMTDAQREEMQAMRETMGGGDGGDMGMMAGGEVDEEQMATMQAERAAEGGGVSGGGQMDTMLLPTLIEMLEAKL